jgi:hypothetical protein
VALAGGLVAWSLSPISFAACALMVLVTVVSALQKPVRQIE